ncbi:MAG TPA: lysophospholipid acyltransferase family protein [Candidatus Limnocylindria bacterium]|nr:lysophospholipid acyltransferase family protein [Candidatus Limnocylindria bacterium]
MSGGGIRFEYRPLPDLDRAFIERLGDYPRGPDIGLEVLRAIGRSLAVALFRLQFRLEVVGRPPELPRVAMAANHASHLDTLAVLAALPRRHGRGLAVLAARDYFFRRWERAAAAALVAQAVAFDRQRYTELREWSRRLAAQQRGCLLFYPSGSRRERRAQRGMLLVVARSGWPLVPVAISGTREAWPVGARVWRPFRRIRVVFGEPLTDVPAAEVEQRLEAFWREHAG